MIRTTDILEEVHLLRFEKQRSGDRMDWRISYHHATRIKIVSEKRLRGEQDVPHRS